MCSERTARERPGGIVAAGPAAVLLVLLLAGCATSVPGTPWPAGSGPAPPAVTAVPQHPSTGPSAFTEPDPATEPPHAAGSEPGTGRPVTAGPAGPPGQAPAGAAGPAAPDAAGQAGAAHPATTVAPVPVPRAPSGAGMPPGARTRPPLAAATPPPDPPPAVTPPAGPGTRRAPSGPRPAPVPPLTSDVVADECLLDGPALAGLLGVAPAVPAANAETRRSDGSRHRSCFAVGGSATVSVNVYTTNRVAPARYVRDAAGARTVTGAGTTAAVLDTVAGPALQLGTARHLVTISVAGRSPTDDQWRAAARAAAAALARR
ncbi:hypothetical protein H7X46_11120 [Pseudonocardia sp. C8]|uniref:hypothetical protein n=1 Tax=Pseudonocardia sp. C8 TaxID=2762759 RepID=UPI00164321F4|nr:hypothetical protein [Pseudonocardia sp. C8]MBC3191614.1 hypothetical protein [Pseudonocardia sp. C8]